MEFDKRHQNVNQIGIVQFFSQEPARFAAAGPKCFYFQSDHWRSEAVEDNGATKIYEWDGHYFFDKATGDGGAWVTNFNVNGQTGNPADIPGMPPDYGKFFGPGTGGVISHNQVAADPNCAARAQKDPSAIYAGGKPGAGTPGRGCMAPSGRASTRRIGPVALGTKESAFRARLGDPQLMKRGFDRYCLQGGGSYMMGMPGDRSGEGPAGNRPAVMVKTTGHAYDLRGLHRGAPGSRLRKAFPTARRVTSFNRTAVFRTSPSSRALVGVRSGRVAFLAVYDTKRIRTRAALHGYLVRSLGY